ncbi:MAG: NAD(P)H-dependent oxidoreductase [Gammaproteobacteria bacterium]|nr:NAD(P)H-dependent oxidoreductase [Gammaproteobacteria bacterium]
MAKILAFAGSARKDSLNKKLLKIVAAGAEAAGAHLTLVDLADFEMPLFNQDLETEAGMPDRAGEFKRLMIEHDGFLIASPEYNSAFSPLLKNTLDWASRAESEDEPPLVAFRGKTAAILATSPGGLGGIRGLVHLRMMLGNLGVIVMPEQQAVPNGFQAFNDEGSMNDEKLESRIRTLGGNLVQFTDGIKSS